MLLLDLMVLLGALASVADIYSIPSGVYLSISLSMLEMVAKMALRGA